MDSELLEGMLDCEIVLDTDARLSYLGKLKRFDSAYIEIDAVAVYDDREVKVSLEEFLVECAKNGVPASRGRTLIPHGRILAISPLSEIVQV